MGQNDDAKKSRSAKLETMLQEPVAIKEWHAKKPRYII